MREAGVPDLRDVVGAQVQHLQGKVSLQLTPLHAADLIVLPETHKGRALECVFFQGNIFPAISFRHLRGTLHMRSPVLLSVKLSPAGWLLQRILNFLAGTVCLPKFKAWAALHVDKNTGVMNAVQRTLRPELRIHQCAFP